MNNDQEEIPTECYACHAEGVKLKKYKSQRLDGPEHLRQDKWLCELCAGTMAGNAVDFPEFYPQADVLNTICYVGNQILKAIKESAK